LAFEAASAADKLVARLEGVAGTGAQVAAGNTLVAVAEEAV